ncbi:MAG: glutamate--tRNA ligase, partial [Synergistaceae bacterium]|nr:glutamate--tRNA ligase [Synergistaceae bacterium]
MNEEMMNPITEPVTVRTRFAPSPTGDLHIGGARTALFNFLFARKFAGGAFVLRVDDTDRERSRPEYERNLMEDLRWLGLDWDEGPDMGGPFAPYRQSERTFFYDEILESLRAAGAVYPCFCSEERLVALRAEQAARGEPPRYDGRCRRLPPGEAERRIASGERPCWRFSLPDTDIRFHDEVRGELSFAPGGMGDFVVARSDGCPTYLFTSVADDRLMGITHILRGDEHVPNTARQQAIFDRLGWKAPVYAHIPMILSKDRQKLSKRTGSTPIRRCREEGYLPEAIAAYLSTLSWTPPDPRDFLPRESAAFDFSSAAAAFSLERISASPPVHDEAHLTYWQKEAMRKRGGGVILDWLGMADSGALRRLTEDLLEEHCTLPLLKKALDTLFERPRREPRPEDGLSGLSGLPELPLSERPWLPDLERMLRADEPWEEDGLNRSLRAFMKERGLKGKEFFHPLRLALTGQES